MNVEQKVKKEILIIAAMYDGLKEIDEIKLVDLDDSLKEIDEIKLVDLDDSLKEIDEIKLVDLDDGNIVEELYDSYSPDNIQDARDEFRSGEVETEMSCDYSRHYESKAVATKLSDGTWVGWTYWYGGGKHSNPSEIPWMDEVYELDCVEEEKTIIVKTFSRKE